MKKKATNGHRPGRGTKGPFNSLLGQQFQGRKYVVKGYIVQPRIMLLTDDGQEDNETLGPQFGMYEAQLGLTVPQFMEKQGAKLRSDG